MDALSWMERRSSRCPIGKISLDTRACKVSNRLRQFVARLAPPIIINRFHDLIDSDLWTLLDQFHLVTQQTLTRLRPC